MCRHMRHSRSYYRKRDSCIMRRRPLNTTISTGALICPPSVVPSLTHTFTVLKCAPVPMAIAHLPYKSRSDG